MLGRAFLYDAPILHKDHAVADLSCKAHFVGDNHHGHPLSGQSFHHIEDLSDHFGVQSAGRFVKEHDFRHHGKGSRNGHTLLLAPA